VFTVDKEVNEMTVAELIQILQTLDPSEVVRVSHPELDESAEVNSVMLYGPSSNIPVITANFF
jgi:hypothetical protein